MSLASGTLRVLDNMFGWGWNLAGRPSPLEMAAIDLETTAAIKKAGGGEVEIKQARREMAAVYNANQQPKNPKACTASVENFLACAETTVKVVAVLFVVGVTVLAAPYVARAYREVKKSFK